MAAEESGLDATVGNGGLAPGSVVSPVSNGDEERCYGSCGSVGTRQVGSGERAVCSSDLCWRSRSPIRDPPPSALQSPPDARRYAELWK